MWRNCNLELRLVPPPSVVNDNHHHQALMNLFNGSALEKEEDQQLTIFYNGRVSVCDVTELQARAIILLASQEMETKTPTSEPCSPLKLQSHQLYSPSTTGLSMKKSLQRFLQKRKHRIQATSPYYNHT